MKIEYYSFMLIEQKNAQVSENVLINKNNMMILQ